MQRGAPFLPTAYATFQECEFQPLDLQLGRPRQPRAGRGRRHRRSAGRGRRFCASLDEPWFVYTENFGEDLYFSQKCFEAEIPMFVDTGCRMGHLSPAAVIPAWLGSAGASASSWRTALDSDRDAALSGIIGVAASRNARYSTFTECLANLAKAAMAPGQSIKTGIDIATNRRDIVREHLESRRHRMGLLR